MTPASERAGRDAARDDTSGRGRAGRDEPAATTMSQSGSDDRSRAGAGAGSGDGSDGRSDIAPGAMPVQEPQVGRFVERLGAVLAQAGVPRLPARVFAALLADDDGRMTSAELVEVLGVSPASVSGGVRYLTQVHWIHRERERGTRRDVYVVRDDAWQDATANSAQAYEPIRVLLAEGVEAVGGAHTRAGRRLALSVEFLDFLSEEMADIARRWEKRRGEITGPG